MTAALLPPGLRPTWLAREESAMNRQSSRRAFVLGMLALGLPVRASGDGFPGGLREAFGPRFDGRPSLRDFRAARRRGPGVMGRLRHWNEVAVDASGVDHTPVPPGAPRVFGEQVGPGRASRAMAIVHIAVFDALNAGLGGGYQGYTGLRAAPADTSLEAAIALAAHGTLTALFPSQRSDLDAELADDLGEDPRGARHLGIHWSFDKTEGIMQGWQVADFVYRKAFVPQRR
jgi:hypothetical protein